MSTPLHRYARLVPLAAILALLILYGWLAFNPYPSKATPFSSQVLAFTAGSFLMVAAGMAARRFWRPHWPARPVASSLAMGVVVGVAAVAGLTAFEIVDTATHDLPRNYRKALTEGLTEQLTIARYWVMALAFTVGSAAVFLAVSFVAGRAGNMRESALIAGIAAGAIIAASAGASIIGDLGNVNNHHWIARVSVRYVDTCTPLPGRTVLSNERYCARGSPPLSDYLFPYGELTALFAGFLVALITVSMAVGVASIGVTSGWRNVPRRVPLAIGTILGAFVMASLALYVTNAFSPFVFSYDYHPPPSVARFVGYCLALLGMIPAFTAVIPALLAVVAARASGSQPADAGQCLDTDPRSGVG